MMPTMPMFTLELVKNLIKKSHFFEDAVPGAKDKTVIFTNDPKLWRTDRQPQPVICVSEPLPPIPSGFHHEESAIGEAIVTYLFELCLGQKYPLRSIDKFQVMNRGRLEVHLILSTEKFDVKGALSLRYLKNPARNEPNVVVPLSHQQGIATESASRSLDEMLEKEVHSLMMTLGKM